VPRLQLCLFYSNSIKRNYQISHHRTLMDMDIPICPTLLLCTTPSTTAPPPPLVHSTAAATTHDVLTMPAQDKNGKLIPTAHEFLLSLCVRFFIYSYPTDTSLYTRETIRRKKLLQDALKSYGTWFPVSANLERLREILVAHW
jgi:hypothetical protein